MQPIKRVGDLIGADVGLAQSDAGFGRGIDAVIDMTTGSVVYVMIERGILQGGARFIVPQSRLSLTLEGVKAEITDEELSRAETPLTDDDISLNLHRLPPVVVGPFGYTVAPTMAAAVANAAVEKVFGTASDRPDIALGHEGWHWFSRLKETLVFDGTKVLGALEDFVLQPGTFTCSDIEANHRAHGVRAYRFSDVRTVARDGGGIVLERDPVPYYSAEAIARDLSDD